MELRPSLNMRNVLESDAATQEESWMLSYIDVFVLMTTLFVMLIVLNPIGTQSGEQGIAEATAEQEFEPTESQGKDSQQEVITRDISEASHQDWMINIESAIAEHELDSLVNLNKQADFTELEIASRVLFLSGDAELTRSGEAVLENLLPVLKATDGVIFIEGHTDDRPIETKKFPSNWELASARATEVLQFFVAEGMQRERFRAVSYADTKPTVPNDSVLNRSKNRRVSLVIHRNRQGDLIELSGI